MPRQALRKPASGLKELRARQPQVRLRVSNPERSAAMRSKLLDATIESLFEVGYFHTSTVAVTERAGVSRGAMLHHFPSKADLIMAASRHIVELRRNIHTDRLGKFTTDREKFLYLIDVLWEAFQTPSGIARIEIMVGARSDPEIGPRFRKLNDELEERHKQRVWSLAQKIGIKDQRRVRAFVQLYAAALRGLAIDSLSPGSRSDIKGAVALLKDFQVLMVDALLAK
ncbi:MAG: TetR/AcrR family transcriptional regulator [Hyphomonadaceae bacterium]